ncbi:MAG: dual specificity protein phosphatase family protein [Pseudomonas sp.]|jgi:protein tyrosine/serine phosphatase|nr:dual specificity protein phosphatase family protein [Pseudomonas sp.]
MRRYRYTLFALAIALLGTGVLLKSTLLRSSVTPLATLNSIEPRPARWAQSVDASYHLYKMDALLYRSALPRAKDQQWLQEHGVQTVINFYQKPDSAWLHDQSIQQVHIPLRTDRIDDVDVLRVLRSIASAQQQGKVLIHCKHGQNRTGLIAAMYRIVFEGWSKADALLEMQQGYGGTPRMDDATGYLEKVDVAAIEHALASGACSTQSFAWCQMAQWFSGPAHRVLSGAEQSRSAWVGDESNAVIRAGI